MKIRNEMLEKFEKHVENLNLSRRDDFIVESIKISYFSGWADAMNHLTENWFNPNAEECRVILEKALKKLQNIQAEMQGGDEYTFDISEPEPVSMNYQNIKLDD